MEEPREAFGGHRLAGQLGHLDAQVAVVEQRVQVGQRPRRLFPLNDEARCRVDRPGQHDSQPVPMTVPGRRGRPPEEFRVLLVGQPRRRRPPGRGKRNPELTLHRPAGPGCRGRPVVLAEVAGDRPRGQMSCRFVGFGQQLARHVLGSRRQPVEGWRVEIEESVIVAPLQETGERLLHGREIHEHPGVGIDLSLEHEMRLEVLAAAPRTLRPGPCTPARCRPATRRRATGGARRRIRNDGWR